MASTLCKIHVNNSTGVSLNERFTAISTQPKVTVGGRGRSRSVERTLPHVDNATSRANQRFLAELQRKHKLQAAMKLKRRSMRTVGGSGGSYGRIKRGSVKALRVGASGKPIRTNSLANIATMNADREVAKRQNTTPLRRSNSSGSLVNRLGPRRPVVGGAAQRIAKRRLDRQRGGGIERGGRSLASGISGRRGRSRNRSLTRVQENGRSRSRSRTQQNIGTVARGRSRGRSRIPVRGRSRSRSRGREGVAAKAALPVKARLGVRPGANVAQNSRRGGNRNRRSASLPRRGVQTGRVQKRQNPINQNATNRASGSGNVNRPRSRSAIRNANGQQRSQSRSRKGQVGQQRGQGQALRRGSGQNRGQAKQRVGTGQIQQRGGTGQVQQGRRGRSQQRRGGGNSVQKGSNNPRANIQARRGRSRSRGGARNQGKSPKDTVNKDELDKELDQYMATTKTENDMDFLLKN